jgi:penicillin V acylase-like amidase (Ntn superfamily)
MSHASRPVVAAGAVLLSSLLLLAAHVPDAAACSNFAMNNEYRLSVRTMDLGSAPVSFGALTVPKGTPLQWHATPATHAFVGFATREAGVLLPHIVSAGLNDQGVSCDMQTLLGTQYPNASSAPNASATDVGVDNFCETVMGLYGWWVPSSSRVPWDDLIVVVDVPRRDLSAAHGRPCLALIVV